jgi:hypothetical protein
MVQMAVGFAGGFTHLVVVRAFRPVTFLCSYDGEELPEPTEESEVTCPDCLAFTERELQGFRWEVGVENRRLLGSMKHTLKTLGGPDGRR